MHIYALLILINRDCIKLKLIKIFLNYCHDSFSLHFHNSYFLNMHSDPLSKILKLKF